MSRTKNRNVQEAISFPANTMRWSLAPYIRLSKEDLNRGKDDNNSVINQSKLLDEYYQQHMGVWIAILIPIASQISLCR